MRRGTRALGSVQGVYLIADSSTGQLYVGKAERILGRWNAYAYAYARDGHGGNVALKELAEP
jgi:excinuclease UvrABC nuclease subunit